MPRPLIGVMGSGTDEYAGLAEPLGRWIAEQGFDLLTGGGAGAMAAVCRGFASAPERRGVSIGVLPGNAPDGYPNQWVDVVIRTHLPKRGTDGAHLLSRNHINVLSSDVIVVLPGGAGTRTEIALATRYERPLIAYLGSTGLIEGLPRNKLPAVAVGLSEVKEFVLRFAAT